MHASELCIKIENLLISSIRGNYPLDWQENEISRRIVKGLRFLLNGKTIIGFKDHINVNIVAYKLTKRNKNEQKYGDIALLVTTKYKNGDILKGIAFLEAKRIDDKSNKFKSLKYSQIEKILSNTSKSHLLLYDYEPILLNSMHFYQRKYSWKDTDFSIFFPPNFAGIVQSNLALETKHKDRKLYNYARSFTHQFVFRFLNSQDLDFNDNLIKNIVHSQKTDKSRSRPQYLMDIKLGHGMKTPETEITEISSDIYRRIQDE